jgi:hypothetical protein
MKVITLAKTKELLGITDTASDTKITAKIKYVDSKVKQIMGNRLNYRVIGDITLDSEYVAVYSIITPDGTRYDWNYIESRWFASGINNNSYLDDLSEYLEVGQLIEGTGIAAETYIDEIYYNGGEVGLGGDTYTTPVIKLSIAATEDASGSNLYLGISIAYQDIIAKGIQYLINGTNTRMPGKAVTSVGRVSYSDKDSAIDGRYGMPSWFVKSFPKYTSGH